MVWVLTTNKHLVACECWYCCRSCNRYTCTVGMLQCTAGAAVTILLLLAKTCTVAETVTDIYACTVRVLQCNCVCVFKAWFVIACPRCRGAVTRCIKSTLGCAFQGPRSALQSHLWECAFRDQASGKSSILARTWVSES